MLSDQELVEHSVTYRRIFRRGYRQGMRKGLRRVLLLLGNARFGMPLAAAQSKIESIASVRRLKALTLRLLEVDSWDELLGAPAKPKARRRKG